MQPGSIGDHELDEAITAYQVAVDGGSGPSQKLWVQRYPQIAQELRLYFDQLDQIERIVAPLRATLRAARRVAELSPAVASWGSMGPFPELPGYEVLEILGAGGMGVVYRARHLRLRREVALKVLHGKARSRHNRFDEEGRALARLQHAHIVKVYDFGEHADGPYLALEYVEGTDLSKRFTGSPWPERQAATLVEKVARAAHHAHTKGVIHRDLKPSNILLTADGEPKITDFGTAKLLTPDDEAFPAVGASTVTAEGMIIGTALYMSPEQAQGLPQLIGPATDVFALGIILYELLTGRRPFEGNSVEEVRLKIIRQEPRPLREYRPQVDSALEAICLRCLMKPQADRYASALDLAEDLASLAKAVPGQTAKGSPLDRHVKRRGWLAAGALGLACAVVALIAGFWPRANETGRAHRKIITHAEVLRILVDDLENAKAAERANSRYITLAHWFNDGTLTDDEVARRKVAVERLAHQSRDSEGMFRLKPIGDDGIVYVLDWPEQAGEMGWKRLLAGYPYGLTFEDHPDDHVRTDQRRLSTLSRSLLPYVRADWFLRALAGARQGCPVTWLDAKKLPAEVLRIASESEARGVDLETAAAELGLKDSHALQHLIGQKGRTVDTLGLAGLIQGGVVSRSSWESHRFEVSPFQALARELHVGTPLLVFYFRGDDK